VARLKSKVERQANVHLHLDAKIKSIKRIGEEFLIQIVGSSKSFKFDRVILTTGGMYRMGDLGLAEKIYGLPTDLEHTVTDVSPSLCPLIFRDKALRQFSGISFVGRLNDLESRQSLTDDLLITHFGISGPVALDFSSFAGDRVTLSFITSVTEKEFITEFNAQRMGKNSIKKFLKKFLPQRLVNFHLERVEITQNFIADLPKQKLKLLVKSCFHYPIPERQKNTYPGSWTTKGGVPLGEVKTKNLESKSIPHLYFAGEVLDFNGLCGGYNISFAMISAQIVADDLMVT
jgi:predicted Rossmann fold flavoprotein